VFLSRHPGDPFSTHGFNGPTFGNPGAVLRTRLFAAPTQRPADRLPMTFTHLGVGKSIGVALYCATDISVRRSAPHPIAGAHSFAAKQRRQAGDDDIAVGHVLDVGFSLLADEFLHCRETTRWARS